MNFRKLCCETTFQPCKKAAVFNGVPSAILRTVDNEIVPDLIIFHYHSLETGILTDDWRHGNVISIYWNAFTGMHYSCLPINLWIGCQCILIANYCLSCICLHSYHYFVVRMKQLYA